MYSIIMMIVMSGLSSACYAIDAQVPGPAFAAHGAGAPAGAGAGAGGGEMAPVLTFGDLLTRTKQEFFNAWLLVMQSGATVKSHSRRMPKPQTIDMAGFEESVMQHVLKRKNFMIVDDVEKVFTYLVQEPFRDINSQSQGIIDLKAAHTKFFREERSLNLDQQRSDFLDPAGQPNAFASRARTIDPVDYRALLLDQQDEVRTARNWLNASPFKRLNLQSESKSYSEVGAEHGMVFNSKVHAPQFEKDLPEIPQPEHESQSDQRKRESKNAKIRDFNNARQHLLANAKNRFIRRPKSTPRKYFERADAFGVNTGILGDVADVLSFDSQNAKLMAAGAAASVAGRSADALYGRGAMSNSKTLEQERRLNRGLFGETEFNAEPTLPPAGENTEKAYKKADRRYGADHVSAGVSMLERQVAQPVLALYDHTNVALNAKATLAYNKFLAQNKNKPAVQKYLRRLRAKKGAIFAMMALETFLKSGAHWAHTRRETDPAVENPTKKDSKVVSNANTMAALGAAVGLARRGLTTYVKHKHVSAANDHADSLYDTDKEDTSEDDDMPVHQAVAGMTR